MTLRPPAVPFFSNVTGDWITAKEATDPEYWVSHLRGAVRFADGLATLAENPQRVYLEVGPGKALTSLAGQPPDIDANQVINSLRHPDDPTADDAYFLATLGMRTGEARYVDAAVKGGEHLRSTLLEQPLCLPPGPTFRSGQLCNKFFTRHVDELGPFGVVEIEVDGVPLVVLWDSAKRSAGAFLRELDGAPITLVSA